MRKIILMLAVVCQLPNGGQSFDCSQCNKSCDGDCRIVEYCCRSACGD